MRRIIYIWIAFMFSMQATAQTSANSYSIKAFIPGLNTKEVELFAEGRLIHIGKVQNDMFSYNGQSSKTQYGLMRIQQGRSVLFIPFFIEPGLIRIRQDKYSYTATGTPTNNAYTIVSSLMDSVFLQDGIRSKDAVSFRYEYITEFIKRNPSSYASVKLIDDVFYKAPSTDDKLYYELFMQLDKKLHETFIGRKIKGEVFKRYATAVGNKAPQIELPDSSGTIQPFINEGELTLITFWASWCVPCRKDLPYINELASKYSSRVKIVGVSLDTNKNAWKTFLTANNWGHRQYCDGGGFASRAATTYGVQVIPSHFLVNAEGIVVAKNISIEEVEKILSKK